MNEMQQVLTILKAQDRNKPSKEQTISWISGYAYGETGEGDLYICLYHPHERMLDKICKVYPDNWYKLPSFIQRPTETSKRMQTNSRTKSMNKTEAREQGYYVECNLFEIVMYLGEANDASLREKRFFDVLTVSQKFRDGYTPPSAPKPSSTIDGQPFSPTLAIEWIAKALAYSTEDAETFYTKVRDSKRPRSAAEMWREVQAAVADKLRDAALERGNIDEAFPGGGK